MEETKEIIEKKELTPRQKAAKERMAKRRKAGYDRWLKEKKKEREKEKKRKEKEKEKLRKEKEKAKHKRPVGRPKKRGRKKKKKSYYVKKRKPVVKKHFIDYKIVDCRNNKQIKYIGAYSTIKDAYKAMDELMKESKEIAFPVQINHRKTITIPVFEYLILEKNRNGDKKNPMLRNEFGKLEEQKTNSKNWVILDKFRHDVEETFWVWGFNNKTERKTFQWIYYNIILTGLDSKFDMKRVILYKNKIVIKNDYEQIDMIICKTMSDSIRFYNLLDEWIKRDKIKQIVMLGSYNQRSERRRNLEDKLMELTGWDRPKIQMRSTAKHTVK